MSDADIVLTTMNARWSHASFGLRCIQAALGPALERRSVLLERTIEHRAVDVAEAILARQPRIVGIGVYVWNATLALDVVRVLKRVRPELIVVLGGPEVSHELDRQEIVALADYVVKGEGELAFRALVENILAVAPSPPSPPAAPGKRGLTLAPARFIDGGRPDLSSLPSPYRLYDDVDLKDRVVYVEASRGCPFTCSFCLSALDDGVRTFPLEQFLADMDALLARGLRRFKFVDRTFNLKIDDAVRILDFFADPRRAALGLFLHFEMIPDRLPAQLRERLAQFAPGTVQLEVGIQTFDDATAARSSRRQDVARIHDNLRWLAEHTGVHVHADLIAGLPGEDLATFARGFDKLLALGPQEIQVGLLKRLRGSPLTRDADAHPEWGLVFDAAPPYALLQSAALSFADVQRVGRFARALDLTFNGGRFPRTSRMMLLRAPLADHAAGAAADSCAGAFDRFMRFSDWLYDQTGARHGIALSRLATLIARYLVDVAGRDAGDVTRALESDLGRDRLPAELAAPSPSLPKRQARRRASRARA